MNSHPETGLDFAQARMYANVQGRFTSVDPLNPLIAGDELNTSVYSNQPQNWNKYSYSLNQPTRYIDPDGKNPLIVVGAVIGGAVGAGAKYIELKAKGEEVTPQKLLAAGVSGMIGGAVAGATGGASLIGQIGTTMAANVVGGLIERGIDGDEKTSVGDFREMIADGAGGIFGAATGGKVGKAATSLYFASEPFDMAFKQVKKDLFRLQTRGGAAAAIATAKMKRQMLGATAHDVLSIPNVIKLGAEEMYGKATEDAFFKLAIQAILARSLGHKSVDCGAPGSGCKTDSKECLNRGDCKT